MSTTTTDMLKYLDKGERILSRVAPRINVPHYFDETETPEQAREFKRQLRNLDKFAYWRDGLPAGGEWSELRDALDNAEGELFAGMERARIGLRDARYYLGRMRLLALRGESYSPLLSRDELAADLRANGIILDRRNG